MKAEDKFKYEWLVAALAWVAQLWALKSLPSDSYWVVMLLLLSACLLMPLSRRLLDCESQQTWWPRVELGCALLIAVSFIANTVVYIIPWLLIRSAAALEALGNCRKKTLDNSAELALLSARVFPAIGAAWLVANRANWTPWGFDPLIVLLTAAHFHHAGFTLPLMAGLNAKAKPGCWTRFSCVAILLGVPLVAVGITCTHFGVLKFVEPFGVTILVMGALGVALSQMRRGLEKKHPNWTRFGFLISGASLFIAMLLALSFGLRYLIPNYALTMPQMWMIHGTLNAIGFGLCGILAWRGASKQAEHP
ncbi:YndJ family transporter [Prosthecobacter sp.]|uniref:YndJ family transporter n=1 Tax=Prosthecobacter sp. TaxID=1965333 RepID=UPI002488D16D|nr:YndJ family transporter [Prosthecobacter sp.]MDI1313176.1 YndJ family transporter [Prosthecobacter sp.]